MSYAYDSNDEMYINLCNFPLRFHAVMIYVCFNLMKRYVVGSSRSTVVVHWTAGQQVARLILLLGMIYTKYSSH